MKQVEAVAGIRKRMSTRGTFFTLGAVVCVGLSGLAVRSVLIQRMMLPRLVIDDGAAVVAISANGRIIVTGEPRPAFPPKVAHPANVCVWDARSGRLMRSLYGTAKSDFRAAMSPDGSQVIASQDSETVAAWDTATGRLLWTMPGHGPLCYSPDGMRFACGGDIFDAKSHKRLCHTGANPDHTAGQNKFTPDGKLLGVIDQLMRVRRPFDDRKSFDLAQRDRYYDDYYRSERLHFWRTDTGKEALDLPQTGIQAFDIAPDGKWLISLRRDSGLVRDGCIVRRIDMATGAVAWTRKRANITDSYKADEDIVSVAISRNGKYVVLLNGEGNLIVVDAPTGRERFRSLAKYGVSGWVPPEHLDFSADGRMLVSRSNDKVLVWAASILQ